MTSLNYTFNINTLFYGNLYTSNSCYFGCTCLLLATNLFKERKKKKISMEPVICQPFDWSGSLAQSPFSSELTIGFEQNTYTTAEEDGTVTVCAEILEGSVQRSVGVSFTFEAKDGTAGEWYTAYS